MSSRHRQEQIYVPFSTSADNSWQVQFTFHKGNMTLRDFQMKIHKNYVGEINHSAYAYSIRNTRIKIKKFYVMPLQCI